MASRNEPGVTSKHSVDPAKEVPNHDHNEVPVTHNPAYTDRVHKDSAGKKLVEFVDHDDGFLKVRRALDSSDLHLTWTWSVGRLAGRYVYVRVLCWQVGYGLELLMQKLLESEAGLRTPTRDKLGNDR